MRARQASTVAHISVLHGLIHTVEFSYAALLSRIDDEFGAGLFVLGIVANGFAFTFGFSALPSGILVDRLGTQRVLTIAFGLAAIAALLVATSPNTVLLGIFLGLLGLSIGLYHPAGISFIAQATSKRGLALGWHGLAGNLGIAAAPLITIGMAEAFGWRWAYVLIALLCLLAAASLRFITISHDSARTTPEPQAPPPSTANSASRRSRFRTVLPLLLVYGVFVLNGFVYRGSLTFLPLHIEETLHISWFGLDEVWLASSLTTLALLAGAVGQLFGGAMSERFRLERMAVPFTLALLPTLLLVGLTSGLWVVLFASLFVFANFSSQPIYAGLIADYSPPQALGRSYGVSFFAAFGIGSVAASFSGFFADRWGTDSVFLVLSAFVVLTLILAAGIWYLSEQNLRGEAKDGETVAGSGG
ncbi:MAG: MFS transporter [Chloroflexi bacterium]|nr:MFS transporter [Chloroflexota bacterium]